MIILKEKFLKNLKTQIAERTETLVIGGLDPMQYRAFCAEIQVLKDTINTFEDIWKAYMKSSNYDGDIDLND